MNYINIGDDSLNLQRITDNWTKNQPILMVVNTNLNHQFAEEQIGKGTLFSMLPIQGLSFLPNDSPYSIIFLSSIFFEFSHFFAAKASS